MVLFVRIEVYYWILPNKSKAKIVMSICITQKSQNDFSNFRVQHALHGFSRKPAVFEKFDFYQRTSDPSVKVFEILALKPLNVLAYYSKLYHIFIFLIFLIFLYCIIFIIS